MKSLFITFEGQEGAGKSTQIKLLADFLQAKGHDVILTRDPGGTKIAEEIRHILINRENAALSKETEALLYIASRAQLALEVIWPHLNKGGIVLCDRFADSTVAYQGFGNFLDIGRLAEISSFAVKSLVPDITFLLAIDPAAGLARKAAHKELDRIEAKEMEYHNLVKRGYDYLAAENPQRIITINGELKESEIHEIVKSHLAFYCKSK